MDHSKIASIVFISICALISSVTQAAGAFLCLGIALVLFGFILWLESKTNENAKEIEERFIKLEDKVNAIQLSRIGGR